MAVESEEVRVQHLRVDAVLIEALQSFSRIPRTRIRVRKNQGMRRGRFRPTGQGELGHIDQRSIADTPKFERTPVPPPAVTRGNEVAHLIRKPRGPQGRGVRNRATRSSKEA